MRFLLAFHITLVIKDKNKFDIHIPYMIYSLHIDTYTHTYIQL